jgi:hypothetical protein
MSAILKHIEATVRSASTAVPPAVLAATTVPQRRQPISGRFGKVSVL